MILEWQVEMPDTTKYVSLLWVPNKSLALYIPPSAGSLELYIYVVQNARMQVSKALDKLCPSEKCPSVKCLPEKCLLNKCLSDKCHGSVRRKSHPFFVAPLVIDFQLKSKTLYSPEPIQ